MENWILSGFLALLLYLLISIVIWSLRNGISPMPTSPKVKKSLFEILPKKIKGPIYELGSGWGTLALAFAQHYPEASIIGYETSPIPFYVSKWRARSFSNLKLEKKDFFYTSLKDAALVMCYLYPGAMQKLKPKLEHELQPGAWVISHTFAIPGWQAVKVYEVPDIYRTKIYVYHLKGSC